MPKDEFDFDDPMELQGVGLFTSEETTEAMAECFIEEFLRMGFDHHRILDLFKNPFYIGMNMVLQNRGEEFVKNGAGRSHGVRLKNRTHPQILGGRNEQGL